MQIISSWCEDNSSGFLLYAEVCRECLLSPTHDPLPYTTIGCLAPPLPLHGLANPCRNLTPIAAPPHLLVERALAQTDTSTGIALYTGNIAMCIFFTEITSKDVATQTESSHCLCLLFPTILFLTLLSSFFFLSSLQSSS